MGAALVYMLGRPVGTAPQGHAPAAALLLRCVSNGSAGHDRTGAWCVSPTAVAERLRGPVRRAMETIRAKIVPASPFVPATSERTFAVSLSDLGDLVFLPDFVARLRASAPAAAVRSVAVAPNDMLRGLADGSIHIALGHLTDFDDGCCFAQTLFEQPLACLARADHPWISNTNSFDQYLAADHAVVAQEGRRQDVFERRVQELGLSRRTVLHSPHFMSVPFLVARSDMITIVPMAVGRIFARLLELKLLPVPFAVPAVALKQFWHRRAHTDPADVWLRRHVADLFVGQDPTRNPYSAFWWTFLHPERDEPGSFRTG